MTFILSILSVTISASPGAYGATHPNQKTPIPFRLVNQSDSSICNNGTQESIEVCVALNRLRAANGAPALKSDRHLTQVAMAYARELYEKKKLTHGDFSARMRHAGIAMPAAENIAAGQKTPERVLESWSGSRGHFANMVNPTYKLVGVGYYQNYWVQIFSSGAR